MGFWSGVGDFFEDYGDDILVGAVSVAGFAVGGPIGAAVAGAVAGGIAAGVQGENIAMGAGFGALGGVLGGVGSFGVKGALGAGKSLAAAEAKNLAAATGDAAAKAAAKMALNRGAIGWLPTKLGAAHLPPGRFYMGLGGAALAPSTGNFLEDSFRKNILGYPAIPVIDITDAEEDWPKGQSPIFMPDPANLPHDLEFTSPMQQNYRTLVPTYKGLGLNFGDSARDNALPREMDVSDISGEEAAGIPSYVETVAALREVYRRLRSGSEIVAHASERTIELCEAGRSDISGSADALKSFAETDPRDVEQIKELADGLKEKPNENIGQPLLTVEPEQIDIVGGSEDLYAMILISSALVGAEAIVTAYSSAFQALAVEADKAAQHKQSEQPRGLGEKKKTGEEQTEKPGTNVDPSYRPTTNQTTPGTNNPVTSTQTTQAPPALDLESKDSAATESAAESPVGSRTGADQPGSGTSRAASDVPGSPGTSTPAIPAVSSVGGSGSGFESMMLAPLMSAMMNGRGRRGADRESERRDREHDEQGTVVAAAAPAPGPGSQPGASSTSAATQAGTQSGPAKAASAPVKPASPPLGAVARSPEGNVVYTFPDGRTQEVSAVVAGVLDAAFGNAAHTDARQAYEGTPAAWTDKKRIGPRVDPYQLITGDIGVWEERAAVLAVFDENPDGQLEVVVDGALQAIASLAEMRDSAGEFGGFTGFFHPPGIEKTAAATAPAQPADLPGDPASAAVPV